MPASTPRQPLRPDPPRVLLVTNSDVGRREAVSSLFSSDGVEIVVATPSDAGPPDPRPFGAVVVDADPSLAAGLGASERWPEWLEQLSGAAERGASVLVLLGGGLSSARLGSDEAGLSKLLDWLGIRHLEDQRHGEWFAKVAIGAVEITERVPAEMAIVNRPVLLDLAGGDAVPVLEVSVAFRDRTVMSERRLGSGRVIATGLGNTPEALAHGEVATLLRRSVIPASQLAGRQRAIGFSVLGYGPYGGMGLYHGIAASATDGLEMIAACDSDPARRKAAEEEFPGLRPYSHLSELVADEDVELVLVATPPSSHFELAMALLSAGKHVALEKPMCLSLTEADQLVEAARATDRMLTVHQSRRWDPDFLAVRRAVDSGLLGELFNVETFVGGFEHPCRAWHSEVSISGGAVYDWGSHHLDWILQLMGGFPQSLVVHGHKRVWHDVTNLDQVHVRMAWADGREAEFVQSDVSGIRRPKFFLQGTAGTIAGHYRPVRTERLEPGIGYVSELSHHAEAPVELNLARYEPGYGLVESRLPPLSADRYPFHRNLADHLNLGEPLAVTPESARKVVCLLEAAQASTDAGDVAVALEEPGS